MTSSQQHLTAPQIRCHLFVQQTLLPEELVEREVQVDVDRGEGEMPLWFNPAQNARPEQNRATKTHARWPNSEKEIAEPSRTIRIRTQTYAAGPTGRWIVRVRADSGGDTRLDTY